MRAPVFYENPDDLHCLQASLLIVFNDLGHNITWEEINRETLFENNLYSWSVFGALSLSKKLKGIKLISNLDYREFVKDGKKYLKIIWGKNYFAHQESFASKDFIKEQEGAKKFIKNGDFELKTLTKSEVEAKINDNYLIAMVNPYVMYGETGMASHFVVIYDQTIDSFILHDPGKPPKPSVNVEKDQFMKAFNKELMVVPKSKFVSLKLGRNDPCWCGSGKKWKKCHYPQLG